MKKFLSKASFSLKQTNQFPSKRIILCGVSTGQDSILLLIIFFHIHKQLNFDLIINYCHHFWHLQNFFAFWQIWKITFLFKLPVSISLCEQLIVLENQARIWRKKSLYRAVIIEKTNQILLGHSLSDKIETSLWHLIRGTGTKGIRVFDSEILLTPKILELQFTSQFDRVKKLNSNTRIRNSISKNFFLTCLTRKKKYKLKYINTKYSFPKNNFRQLKVLKDGQKKISEFIFFPKTLFFFNKTPFIERKTLYLTYLRLIEKKSFSSCFYSNNRNYKVILYRPLIKYSRTDVIKIVQKYKLPVLNDQTNQIINFSRNKIRYKVIPLIRFLFSKNFDFLINNFFEISKVEEQHLEKFLQNVQLLFEFHSFLKSCQYLLSNKRLKTEKYKQYFLRSKFNTKKVFITLSNALQRKLLKNFYKEYSANILAFSNIELLRLYFVKKIL